MITTGTGSGKSLCVFVPVVDAIVRARKAGKARGTSTIIVYPMNALANSQLNEIEKFISQSGLCEAELRRRRLPTSAVIWDGNQTAKDGGLDVRGAQQVRTALTGFVPKSQMGFQVRTPDMQSRRF